MLNAVDQPLISAIEPVISLLSALFGIALPPYDILPFAATDENEPV